MSVSNLIVKNLKTNHISNPLGFDLGTAPTFSWITESDTAKFQKMAQVQVAADEKFSSILFDSGKREDIDSLAFSPELTLSAYTRYYWHVQVWADDGSTICSDTAWFETAKLSGTWQAKWITPDLPETVHPILSTSFHRHRELKTARIYACGLGLYYVSLNGSAVSDECLAPGLMAYDKWLPYQSWDVTDLVKIGENAISVVLGNGWYKGRYGLHAEKNFQYGKQFALILELHLVYTDGSTEMIGTNNETWKTRKSPIVDSSIFDGEKRDDTILDQTFYPVKTIDLGYERLTARYNPPIRIKEKLKPVKILHTPAGETILDMGQNMVGWLEFQNYAPEGEEIYLQFGEVLQNENFYRDNLRTALCEYRYISDGRKKTIRQQFTFFGFRFVKLSAWYGPVNLEDFTGLVLYSDMERTGNIETDNPLVNRLFLNTLWGQKGNYLDVPTDCPQRDERMGWTGDAQVFAGTAAFNMDVYAFFRKYLHDLHLEQKPRGGNVPVVVPAHDVHQNGSCAWGDAAVIIPWQIYKYYGDSRILEEQFDSMKGWVDFIRSRDEASGDRRLWTNDFHYADWLSLDVDDWTNRFGGTEKDFLASAFYAYSSGLVAKAAAVLGKNEEKKYYDKLAEEVRNAIQKEYLTPGGRLAITTQTAYVVALHMELLPEEFRETAALSLRNKLKSSKYHLQTGFVGTSYLCPILSDWNSNDIAYRLLLNEDYPSWLYSIKMGATTVWERWNSILPDGSISDTGMNSLNHYSYGSIVEWLYRYAAGISPDETAPGFRKFYLKPQPNERLKEISAEFHSPAGVIKSQWKIEKDGRISFYFKIPFGTTAHMVLPDAANFSGKESIVTQKDLSAGEYRIAYMPAKPFLHIFDLDTPFCELLTDEKTVCYLKSIFPDLMQLMLFDMYAGEASIRDFMRRNEIILSEKEMEEISKTLKELSV